MSSLIQLKPRIVKYELQNDRKTLIDYLFISQQMDRMALQEDVRCGAGLFADCLNLADKKTPKVTIVRCESEEEGFMAVSYLAGIYNAADGVYASMNENEWNESLEERETALVYNCENTNRPYMEEHKVTLAMEDEDPEIYKLWHESPIRIPIVDGNKISYYYSKGSDYENGNKYYLMQSNKDFSTPYWLCLLKYSVCVVIRKGNTYGPGTIDYVRPFSRMKHIFVVISDECASSGESLDEGMVNMLLGYQAEVVNVRHKNAEERTNHYLQVIKDVICKCGYVVERRFSYCNLWNRIDMLPEKGKHLLIELIVRYVIGDKEDNVLCMKDFDFINKLSSHVLSRKDNRSSWEMLMNDLKGVPEIKKQITDVVNVMKYNKQRVKMGLSSCGYHNVHLFLGAPGTAKTTVAKLMGDIMAEEDLLDGKRFSCINGAQLKGKYVGHSAPLTHTIFEENDIILIDEAYSIASSEDALDSFSQEALAQLMIELEDHAMDKLIIFSGYGGEQLLEKDNKMKVFLDANPGIQSRINSTFYFKSYTAEEMVQIVKCQAKIKQLRLPARTENLILQYFEKRVNESDFGNGREARVLLENATRFAATRVMKMDEAKWTIQALTTLSYQDIKYAVEYLSQTRDLQTGRNRRSIGFCG